MNTEAKNLGPVNTMSNKNGIKPILTERGLFVQAPGKFRSPKEFVAAGSIPGQLHKNKRSCRMSFLQGLHARLSPRSQIYEGLRFMKVTCEGSTEIRILSQSAKRCMQYSAIKHVSCQNFDTCHCSAKLCSSRFTFN